MKRFSIVKVLKNEKKHFFSLFIIIFAIIISYWNLPSTFFQQDEWQSLAAHIYHEKKGLTGIIEFFLPYDALSHFNPLAGVFSWVNYILFKNNFTYYAIQSIILHIVATTLLYYFVFNWLRSKKIAFLSSLFFGINSIPSQAVTWVINSNSYELPIIFILISLNFFQQFLVLRNNRKRNIILSFFALFISLMFHENGIFLFLFYPTIFFLFAWSERKKILRIFSISFFLTIITFILIRVPFFFMSVNPIPAATDIARPSLMVYPYRALAYGLKSLAATFFPELTLIKISESFMKLSYPQFITAGNPNPFIAESISFDLVTYILSFFILGLIWLLLKFVHEKKNRQALVWSIIFILMSVTPYAFVLGKAGYASIFEPKFLYVPSIGLSLLLAIIISSLLSVFSKMRLIIIFLTFAFFSYSLFHIFQIRHKVDALSQISTHRKFFLSSILSSYPDIPERVIFFTESDKSYYGMPENEKMLPLQIGFGKMLLIWYEKDEKFPICMYEDNYLINLLAEGYKECGGRGFGYVRDFNKLQRMVKENDIPDKSIIAYSWDSETKEFVDITKDIRKKLSVSE